MVPPRGAYGLARDIVMYFPAEQRVEKDPLLLLELAYLFLQLLWEELKPLFGSFRLHGNRFNAENYK